MPILSCVFQHSRLQKRKIIKYFRARDEFTSHDPDEAAIESGKIFAPLFWPFWSRKVGQFLGAHMTIFWNSTEKYRRIITNTY